MADNDDTINKLIDAKSRFRLKKINDERIAQGRDPLTPEEFAIRNRFDTVTPSAQSPSIPKSVETMPDLHRELLTELRNNATTDELQLLAQSYLSNNKKLSDKNIKAFTDILRAKDPNNPILSNFPSNIISAQFTPKPTDASIISKNPKNVIDASKKFDLKRLNDTFQEFNKHTIPEELYDDRFDLLNQDKKLIEDVMPFLDDKGKKWAKSYVLDKGNIINDGDRKYLKNLLEENKNKVKFLPQNLELNRQNLEQQKLLSENPELADQRLQQANSRFLQKQPANLQTTPQFLDTNLEVISNDYYQGNAFVDKLRRAYEIGDDFDKKLINKTIQELEQGGQVDRDIVDYVNSIFDIDYRKKQQQERRSYNQEKENLYARNKAEDLYNESKAKGLTNRQPQVEYADFRTTGEKARDSVLQGLKEAEANPYAFTQERIIGPAGKLLGRLAIPVAGYDLGKKMFQSGKEIQEEQKRKGQDVDLAETGLDVSILGTPLTRLLASTAPSAETAATLGGIATGLEGLAAPLGGYLAGKQVNEWMGGEPSKDSPKYYSGDPVVFTPGEPEDSALMQDAAAQMPNYPAIKKLLQKKK